MTHTHINCNGELVFHKKEGRREYYKCSKCNQLVNCILCYSYAEMEEKGII